MPLFVWSILLFAWLIMAVYPVLSAALTLLLLDRGISVGPLGRADEFLQPRGGRLGASSTSTRSGSSGIPRST